MILREDLYIPCSLIEYDDEKQTVIRLSVIFITLVISTIYKCNLLQIYSENAYVCPSTECIPNSTSM